MLNAKISQLKAKLSSYIAKVRKGQTVVIFDRETAVARMIPIGPAQASLLIVRAPVGPIPKRKAKVAIQRDVVELLREDRDQR
jgi:antitoxin (DNA-binding transcriptional repressor) of toxin-antitoxin stability system